MKPIIEITGRMEYPLECGFRAFIKQGNGTMVFISQVVDVRDNTEYGVTIETQNTIYKLTYAKEMVA